MNWLFYTARLQRLVSNYLIDCAIKTRIVQDLIADRLVGSNSFALRDADMRARDGLAMGEFVVGEGDLTLRESCNKIVHASNVTLGWKDEESECGCRVWDGLCHLGGTLNGRPWEVVFNVSRWSMAMANFHAILNEEVDWDQLWESRPEA